MATLINNSKIWYDKYDFTAKMNACSIDYSADMQDDTVFGNDTKSNKPGLKNVKASAAGFWESGVGSVDEAFFTEIGLSGSVLSICPLAGSVGDNVFMFKTALGQYSPGGSVGDLLKFDVTAEAFNSALVNATLLNNSILSASGNSTGFQLGAVPAGSKLYAGLHVIGITGTAPSLGVTIESDDNGSFTTPTTVLTFSASTVINSQWLSLDGPTTDDYFRASFTVSTADTFNVILSIGIA